MVSHELREKARPWIVEQLRIRTDLDPNDMGEYVVTLLEYNGSREELYERTLAEMKEFLGGSAEPFVKALLDEIERLQNPEVQVAQPSAPQMQAPPQQQQFQQGPPQFQQQFNAPPVDFSQFPGLPSPLELMQQMNKLQNMQQHSQNRHRGRSELSSVNNELQYANRRLVIENVPHKFLNEDSIKEYFSQFGSLTRIKIDSSQKLAEIEFQGHDEAVKAHKSPEPIFNNRFIKVFWRKNDPNDPQEVDMNAIKRMQDQRQKEFKEKEAKRKEYQQKIQELIEARAKLLQDQEQLLKRAASGDMNTQQELLQKQKLTADLRQQLEDLKTEAAQLGIVGQTTSTYRGRGRGGPRGAYRGAVRGRGGFRGGRGGGFGAATLDLRPKSLLVKGVSEAQQEALVGQLASSRYSGVQRQDPSSVVVDFSDRRSAEVFYNGGSATLADIGPVEMTWVKGSSSAAGSSMGDMEMAE